MQNDRDHAGKEGKEALHIDGSPKYLRKPAWSIRLLRAAKIRDWKQLLIYFCNSMLYKILALLPLMVSEDREMVDISLTEPW